MSSNIPERSNIPNNPEIDTGFAKVLHQAAQEIGSSEGRRYLVIKEGKLELSPQKGNLSIEGLIAFVNEKLKGLRAEDVPTLKEDLSLISQEYERQGKVYHLANDALGKTMEFFDMPDKARFKSVSQTWNEEVTKVDDRVINAHIKKSFGPERWASLNIDVGKVPALPVQELYEFLNKPSDFWRGKKNIEKSLIPVLIPQIGNGKPFTWNMFVEVMKGLAKERNVIGFDYIWDRISIEHGDKPIEAPFWVVLSNDVIPESRNKSFTAQQALVAAKPGYEVPSLLPAAVSILMDFMVTGESHYGQNPLTYTCVAEQSGGYQAVVGGFAPSGLGVLSDCYGYGDIGVGVLRKF